jgi:hypothetical protein
MVCMKLGDLLREMAQLQGLERVAALALYSEAVVNALEQGAKEGHPISIDISPHMTAEEVVVVQCLFFRWWHRDPGLKDKKQLAKWCRVLAEHPDIFDIPGLEEDVMGLIQRSIAQGLETDPDEFEKGVRRQFPRSPTKQLLRLFWLADCVPPFSLPPGHRFWELLGVEDEGAWDSLTEEQRVKRALLRGARSRTSLAQSLLPAILRQLEKGSTQSISSERTVPLSEGSIDPGKLRGLRVRDWRSEIEERDAARRLLDRLADQVRLTESEGIVFAGMREGLAGEGLKDYAIQRGIARDSVPVLKSRLMAKLRKAAETFK